VCLRNGFLCWGYRGPSEKGIASILSVPIMAKDEVIGALRFYTATPRRFTEDEIMLTTALAHQGDWRS